MKITEKEFKELFELDDRCTIPKETLNTYNKQIKGAYFLYKEIMDIKSKKFKNVDDTKLQAHFEPYRNGFQHFVYTLGSKSKLEVSYIDKIRGSVPFWARTKYEREDNAFFKNTAYKIFISQILLPLEFKYSKYGFKFEYRDLATRREEKDRCHPNQSIWWDGIVFNSLFIKDAENKHKELYNLNIEKTISQRRGIWIGDIPKPIKRIMAEIDKKTL